MSCTALLIHQPIKPGCLGGQVTENISSPPEMQLALGWSTALNSGHLGWEIRAPKPLGNPRIIWRQQKPWQDSGLHCTLMKHPTKL